MRSLFLIHLVAASNTELLSRLFSNMQFKSDGSFIQEDVFDDMFHPARLLMRTDLETDSIERLREELNVTTKKLAIYHFIKVNRLEVRHAMLRMRNNTDELTTILLGARLTSVVRMSQFVRPLIEAVDTYIERRRRICLYDYLPYALRNDESIYAEYFKAVDLSWYGLVKGEGSVLVHLTDEMGVKGYSGVSFGGKLVRFSFTTYMSLGIERIIDLTTMCAVDLNPRLQNFFADVTSRSFFVEDVREEKILVWRDDSDYATELDMSSFEAMLSLHESSSADNAKQQEQTAFYMLGDGYYRYRWFSTPQSVIHKSSHSIFQGFHLDWKRTSVVKTDEDGCQVVLRSYL